MPQVRWGLVGATTIGREWMIAAIREAGGAIVGVMSSDAARGSTYAEEFGIPRSFTSLADMLASGVDAVYIATTNERHLAETLAAARAGVHVLCEKPLAMRLADAREMVAACRKAGVVMATNHHLRNGAIPRAMREMIGAGRIGRPLAARIVHAGYLPEHLHGWRLNNPAAGAGVFLDLTVHDADLLRFILADDPVSVAAASQNGGLAAKGIEDAAQSLLRFRSGLLAQMFEGFTTRYVETGIEVHGSDGSLSARDCLSQTPRGTLTLRSKEGEETVPVKHENYYVRGIATFHDAITGKGRPAATGEDGLMALAVALAAAEAARSGRTADVNPEGSL